jgi:hypothetical protein
VQYNVTIAMQKGTHALSNPQPKYVKRYYIITKSPRFLITKFYEDKRKFMDAEPRLWVSIKARDEQLQNKPASQPAKETGGEGCTIM